MKVIESGTMEEVKMVATKPMTDVRVRINFKGEGGNIFFILGQVTRALKKAGYPELASEVAEAVMSSESYEEALARIGEYVEVVGDLSIQ